MLSCDNCRVRLTVVGNYLKVEKLIYGKVSSYYWLNRTNMYLPDCETPNMVSCPQFGSNVVYPAKGKCLAIKMLCCDGMKTVMSLGFNCIYEYNGTDYTFSSLSELCAFIGAFVCQPACEIVIPCACNISLLTAESDVEVVISTEGTTPNGFLVLDIAGTPFSLPNPNGDLPPIDFLEILRTSGNVISLSRSETNGGAVCGVSGFETFADQTSIPATGADTVIDANTLFTLPACSAPLSFLPIFSDGVTGIVITPTGVITIPAQTVTNAYYYAQALCNGEVLATVALTLGNLPANNRYSGKAYGTGNGGATGNIGGEQILSVRTSAFGNNGNKYLNITSTANSANPVSLSHTKCQLFFYRRPLGSLIWSANLNAGSPVTYTFPQTNVPNLAAWINSQLSPITLTGFKVYDNGVGGIDMFDADGDTWEEYFDIVETQFDATSTPSTPVSWQYGFIQLGGSGDAQPVMAYGGNPFEDGNVTPALDTKQIVFSGAPECPNGKGIVWQSRIGVSSLTNTAGGLVFPAATIQYQELGTAGVNPFPTTATVDIIDPYTGTPIVSGVVNIAAGGTVGSSLLADGDYGVLTSIANTQGKQTQFLKLIRIKSGAIASDTSYNFNPLAIAPNGQDVEFQQLGTPQFFTNDVHMAWLRVDNFLVIADTADFYDNFASVPETAPLDGSVVPISNVPVNSGAIHKLEITWFDNANYTPKTLIPYKIIQFILSCNP